MALSDKFKGLSKHKIEPAMEPLKRFDAEGAYDYLCKVTKEIAEKCGEMGCVGFRPWADEHRPDLMAALGSAEGEVAEAFKAEDRERVFKAVNDYKAAYMRIFEAYAAEMARKGEQGRML